MNPTRTLIIALVVSSAALAGCAQNNPFTSRRTMVGSLKANVVSLESENEQLRRQVATLKNDNRHIEDQLVQEKAHNDDLATRLDNAKGLLSSNGGLDREPRGLSDDDDPIPPPRARKSSRPARKPPAASIPGRIEPDGDTTSSNDERLWDKDSKAIRQEPWLPIARGTATATGTQTTRR